MSPRIPDQIRIKSICPGSHIFVTFEDDAGQILFKVDSEPKNTPNILMHRVFVALSKTTGAISLREMLKDATTPGGASTIAALNLSRNSFLADRVGNEQKGATGKQALVIRLTLQPQALTNGTIVFEPAKVNRLSESLYLQSNVGWLPLVRRIKIHFGYPWANKVLNPEEMKVILQPRGLAPAQPQPMTGGPLSFNRPSQGVGLPRVSSSPETATYSGASRQSIESLKEEDTSSNGYEEKKRIHELEERVRVQAEDNDRNSKRMQELENLFRARAQSKDSEPSGSANASISAMGHNANSQQPTQDPRLQSKVKRDLVAQVEETANQKTRVRELEDRLEHRDALINQLEEQVRSQEENIKKLELEHREFHQPDIAALAAELATARGVDRGDQAGIEARLPSVRLNRAVIERLFINPVFRSLFLELPSKRKVDEEDCELDKFKREYDETDLTNKKIKLECLGTDNSFGMSG